MKNNKLKIKGRKYKIRNNWHVIKIHKINKTVKIKLLD